MTERRPIERRTPSTAGGSYFAAPKTDLEFFSTGCKLLDLAMGGGWCEERVSNIIGDKAVGKTLLAIEASANFCRKYARGKVLYREREHAFQKLYAGAMGMPLSKVDFGKEGAFRTVEDMFEEWERLIHRADSHPILYIVDSLDALSSREELKRRIDKGSYGAEKAAVMSETFRRLIDGLATREITVIIISQMRDNIGAKMFGRKWKRSGGRALDFYASLVLVLSNLGQIKRTIDKVERVTGVHVKAFVDKNKISSPFREAEFDLLFGYGMDDVKACVDWLKSTGGFGPDNRLLGHMKEKPYIDMIHEQRGDWQRALADLHRFVEGRWYSIENSFLPSKRKYE